MADGKRVRRPGSPEQELESQKDTKKANGSTAREEEEESDKVILAGNKRVTTLAKSAEAEELKMATTWYEL
jgi:hypothetical protein